MEKLEEAFAGSFNVSNTLNDTAAPHPRLRQFKQKSDRTSQQERRLRKLEAQKSKRLDYVNKARCLVEEDWANYEEEEEEEEEEDAAEQMESASAVAGGTKKKKRRPRYYRNQLMLSEWLVDVPVGLSTDWLMVLCPAGRRNLVIAAKGKTSHYSKSGYRLSTFPSVLPGGCRKHRHNNTDYSILDCIYLEALQTFYVLDIMCWRGHPVYDSDTEFRFFWLQAKMAELPELAAKTNVNPCKFLPLPNYSCEASAIEDVMAKPVPFEADLDGVLFYHKRAHYAAGSTPLVGWLKPWMLQDMLGVSLPEAVLTSRPPGADLRPPDPSMEAKGGGDGREVPK